jgi:hypothetical protein
MKPEIGQYVFLNKETKLKFREMFGYLVDGPWKIFAITRKHPTDIYALGSNGNFVSVSSEEISNHTIISINDRVKFIGPTSSFREFLNCYGTVVKVNEVYCKANSIHSLYSADVLFDNGKTLCFWLDRLMLVNKNLKCRKQ